MVSEAMLRRAARLSGVPVNILRAQVGQESGGNQGAVSPKGASGVEQLIPSTAAYESRRHHLNTNTPMGNLLAGAYYLREQYNAFKRWDYALAAYNAGPNAVKEHRGIPPYAETQAYVRKIMRAAAQAGEPGPGPRASTRGPLGATLTVTGFDPQAQAQSNLQDLASGHFDPVHELESIHQAMQAASVAVKNERMQAAPEAPLNFAIQGKITARDRKAVQLASTFAQKQIPYVWGGETTKGFDCSGLLQYIWAQQGIKIPRTTYDQWTAGSAVARGSLRPGDAVFFRGSDPRGNLPGHVGIYIGGGKFIEAPHTGATVRISKLAGRKDFVGARRYG